MHAKSRGECDSKSSEVGRRGPELELPAVKMGIVLFLVYKKYRFISNGIA